MLGSRPKILPWRQPGSPRTIEVLVPPEQATLLEIPKPISQNLCVEVLVIRPRLCRRGVMLAGDVAQFLEITSNGETGLQLATGLACQLLLDS